MAQYVTVYDSDTASLRNTSTTISSMTSTFQDMDFDILSGGSSFVASSVVFDANSTIRVWINGTLQVEGAAKAYTRNVSQQLISFTTNIPEGAWVRVSVK